MRYRSRALASASGFLAGGPPLSLSLSLSLSPRTLPTPRPIVSFCSLIVSSSMQSWGRCPPQFFRLFFDSSHSQSSLIQIACFVLAVVFSIQCRTVCIHRCFFALRLSFLSCFSFHFHRALHRRGAHLRSSYSLVFHFLNFTFIASCIQVSS